MPPKKTNPQQIQGDLGDYVRRRREELGLSMSAVASAMDVDRSYIWLVERGQRRSMAPSKLDELARVLRVPATDLYARAGKTTPSRLPDLQIYLRTKFRLDNDDITSMQRYFDRLRRKHESPKGGRSERRRRG